MIALLNGVVAEKSGSLVVLDVNGVGYGVLVPFEDSGRLTLSETAKVYIYEHIRDNSHDLYGFTQQNTKSLFEQLLEVTGVGPKMALNVLGVGTADELRVAIAGGDTKLIQAANGVGKRVAERIVVELKDKVGLIVSVGADAVLVGSAAGQQDEATQALISLGYSLADAVNALVGIDSKFPTEERVKQVLKGKSS